MLTSFQARTIAFLSADDGEFYHTGDEKDCAPQGEEGTLYSQYAIESDEVFSVEGLECAECGEWIEEPDPHYAWCDECSDYTPTDDSYGDKADEHHTRLSGGTRRDDDFYGELGGPAHFTGGSSS